MGQVYIYLVQNEEALAVLLTDEQHKLLGSNEYLGACGTGFGSLDSCEPGLLHFEISQKQYKKGTTVRIDTKEPWNAEPDFKIYTVLSSRLVQLQEIKAGLTLEQEVNKK